MLEIQQAGELDIRNAMQTIKLTLVGRDPQVELGMLYVMCSIIARRIYQSKKDELGNEAMINKMATRVAANICNWGMLTTPCSTIASIIREDLYELRDFLNISLSKPGCICMQSFGIGHNMGKDMLDVIDSNEDLVMTIDRNMKYLIRQDRFLKEVLELEL